jgi:hypothetical protein
MKVPKTSWKFVEFSDIPTDKKNQGGHSVLALALANLTK